ncbi:MAG: hypothetical protein LQ346_002247 [Caloplaca aetnensis]|nr:MAG: hypothetical protein LQ346_002247 [Caloplaca aetnensis]
MAALSSHPDKVSENERAAADVKFKSISKAYEILSDDDKREMYDAHGMAAFEAGNPMGAEVDLDDLLAQMFGMGMNGAAGGGPGSGSRRPRKGDSEEQAYTVTLEELYKGKTTKFATRHNIICKNCKGSGGKDKAKPKECSACHGRGMQQGLKAVGPGLMTQETVICNSCKGTGKVYREKERCKKCKGERVVEEKKVLELYIPRGSKYIHSPIALHRTLTNFREGDKIVIEGEADQLPDQEPGDIVFNLVEAEHSTFRRDGPDLLAEIHIDLSEALCGFSRTVIKHLDGRGIEVKHPQPGGGPLKPGSVLKVAGEGMPHKKSDLRGDLYLIINVDFPDGRWLDQDQRKDKLRALLPKSDHSFQTEMVDEVNYEEMENLEGFGSGEQGDEWEDEDDEGTSQPQCAQQ